MKTRTNINKKSLQALNLANDVIEHIKHRKKINLQALSVRNGYSVKSAQSQKGIRTKTFQNAVIPVIERMKRVHEKAILALDNRDLEKERVDSVVNVARQMVHDTQLLSGKATENVASNVVVYGSDDFLALQVKEGKQ